METDFYDKVVVKVKYKGSEGSGILISDIENNVPWLFFWLLPSHPLQHFPFSKPWQISLPRWQCPQSAQLNLMATKERGCARYGT